MMNNFKQVYKDQVVPELVKKFKYQNLHQVPKIEKITINRGLGEASQNLKSLESSVLEITNISGQKPLITKSKKAIAGFKLREGMPVGVTVTLRSDKMYAFLEKFINLSLPRIRDFKGISVKGFDGHGNFNIGIKEQLIFPEIKYEEVDKIRGMDIAIVTTAKTDVEGFALLKSFNMPFNQEIL
uniref:Large ribosomal subunit protein uL5c n=1 Tax=Bulboplastis apyrenoidosa TaxID=1070855 RepID=A0A1Y9TM71_9RHOD|nr:50S ribosomal protein L5 [Bulboplastis apyrenoidosa]ARO90772.1 50S ribosomal protein L5 [Bulboplastis apyrenoidosa]